MSQAAAQSSIFEKQDNDNKRKGMGNKRKGGKREGNNDIPYEDTSVPSGINKSYTDSLVTIRKYCEEYMEIWARCDAKTGINGHLWVERMHEPRLINHNKYGFSEPLAHWLFNPNFGSEIRLVFSQAGFLTNVIQIMLVFSALKANAIGDMSQKSLIVCAFESDPKVIGNCFIFLHLFFPFETRHISN